MSAESSSPMTPNPIVKASGMMKWSRSMNVAAIRQPMNTHPAKATAGGKRSQHTANNAAVSNSTNG